MSKEKLDKETLERFVAELCLETSLYAAKQFPGEAGYHEFEVADLRQADFQIVAYCINCSREVVFKTDRFPAGGEDNPTRYRRNRLPFSVDFYCQRHNHRYNFYFLYSTAEGVTKIGQFPSTEDIAAADINKYRAVLDKEQFGNLRRAGGLNAHGIGIGAFVYLRRIFERLIQQHREEVEKSNGPITGWNEMRVAERIEALKDVLPPALVEHAGAYAILSQGVHELAEETCLKHFPVVRAAIILMLEQDLQDLERKKAEDSLRREMTAIKGELSSTRTSKRDKVAGESSAPEVVIIDEDDPTSLA